MVEHKRRAFGGKWLEPGAEGWDGDVKGRRQERRSNGWPSEGCVATITGHLQGRPEKRVCPHFHDCPAKPPSLCKKGLRIWTKELSMFAKVEERFTDHQEPQGECPG